MSTPETSPSGAQPEKSETQVPAAASVEQLGLLAALRAAGSAALPGVSFIDPNTLWGLGAGIGKDQTLKDALRAQKNSPTQPVDD